MATAYMRFYERLAKDSSGNVVPSPDESSAVGDDTANITSPAVATTSPTLAKFCLLSVDAICHFKVGKAGAVTATSSSVRLPADSVLFFGVKGGHDISIIQGS